MKPSPFWSYAENGNGPRAGISSDNAIVENEIPPIATTSVRERIALLVFMIFPPVGYAPAKW
jgi:hypothetical protein